MPLSTRYRGIERLCSRGVQQKEDSKPGREEKARGETCPDAIHVVVLCRWKGEEYMAKYSKSVDYERKLTTVMDRLGAKQYNYDWSRKECCVEMI